MAETYTKLFSTIITSSIWSEDDKTRILWITMLALADFNGFVAGSIPGLADMARISRLECETSLKKLEAPDKYSRTQTDEGRRIQKVEGGWKIINHNQYRDKRGSRAEYFRKWRAQQSATETQPNATYTETDIYNKTFVQFWNEYPKHKAKKVAFRAWCKLELTTPLVNRIMAALKEQKKNKNWSKENGQFIPLASTWLNQERWEDETDVKMSKPSPYRECPNCQGPLNSNGECFCGHPEFLHCHCLNCGQNISGQYATCSNCGYQYRPKEYTKSTPL